jgi:antitoxin ParD1/3/4
MLPTIERQPVNSISYSDIFLHKMYFWCIFTPKIKNNIMTRQSISFTQPNDNWLKTQVDSKEYSSKSELVNDLVRQARKQQRQIDWISAKLENAENSGFTNDSKEQILTKSKSLLNGQI